ncbi:hypothetical protein DL765_009528 [Monosporascus sp. GIB2]|nr:hypothetical protein DL765_009528 [Monosporascus sp. GIB2]
MKDYLQNYPDDSSDTTNYIFSKYKHFEERMRALFGDPDKEQHAVKQLYLLRQTKSASKYTTEFNRLAAISNLPESALFYPFYDGLKPQVKDEMYIIPKTGSFAEYTDMAIMADRRTFDRFLEKKGTKRQSNDTSPSGGKPQRGKGKSQKEAGAASREPRGDQSKTDKSNVECFNCGKKGHFKNECRSLPKKNSKKGGIPQPQKKARTAEHESDSEAEKEKREVSSTSFQPEFTIATTTQTQSDIPECEDCPICQDSKNPTMSAGAQKFHDGQSFLGPVTYTPSQNRARGPYRKDAYATLRRFVSNMSS